MDNSPQNKLLNEVERLAPIAAAEVLGTSPQPTIHQVLCSLPADKALLVASHLPGTASQSVAETSALVSGIEGTVERLMSPPIGVLSSETTVAGALDYIVHLREVSSITYIYVVDDSSHLLGVVAMRDLLLGRPGQTLGEIMTSEPFAFSLHTGMPEAINAALKRHYRLYPVVDESNRLLGLVFSWRLFEYVATEISAQTGSMVGLDKEERVTTSIMEAFRMRHPWLQVNLITAFAAAFVVGMFEDTIARIVALAVFLPVLAGQSGNTGCQALAITLRGITLGELSDYPVGKLLRKEIVLGAINGFFVGLVAAVAMWLYAGTTGAEQPHMLAFVILIAMVGACTGSGIFGVLVPLTLRRFGADPAMASSIFLTTFTDILGMGLMLFLATALLL
ncbi:MAG: magnesium transporter [Gammaproteobacteria bacterium]|nr:MAG: magnesium transporter [Gammaproteobacteria bacterium]